jgi:hypothetical protein
MMDIWTWQIYKVDRFNHFLHLTGVTLPLHTVR